MGRFAAILFFFAPIVIGQTLPTSRLSHELGTLWFHGTGLVVGAQWERRVLQTPFYVGPEVNFSLFPSGGILSTLGTASYQMELLPNSGLTLHPGVSSGLAFTRKFTDVSPTLFALFFDLVLNKEVDDLASFRLQIRPGVFGREPVLFINTHLTFRFY